jgi:hypothetical protein
VYPSTFVFAHRLCKRQPQLAPNSKTMTGIDAQAPSSEVQQER